MNCTRNCTQRGRPPKVVPSAARFGMENRKGRELVPEILRELKGKSDKASRIRLHKVIDFMKILAEYGTRAGEPYIKRLDGPIWELRPLRDRILFAAWVDGGFVLLHAFVKKTQKTPCREIEQAKRELADFVERSVHHEQE